MSDLTGSLAVVTGGSRGIGRAMAEALLGRGASVALLDVGARDGMAAAAELGRAHGADRVTFFRADVSSEEALRAALEAAEAAFPGLPLRVMCNNAGVANDGFDRWRQSLEVNVTGVILGTQLAAERMRGPAAAASGGGDCCFIVNTASTAGLVGVPFGPVYAATKHAVVGLSRSLWGLRRSHGIFVHALCPAFTDTAMANAHDLTRNVRLLTPEFIAEGLLKLIDDGAAKQSRCVLACTSKLGLAYVKMLEPWDVDELHELPMQAKL